jgi:hypothetical protein
MSQDILKLALSGKVGLQLEYREVGGELREPDPGSNTVKPTRPSVMHHC